MPASVCLLAPDHAEAFEQRGIVPNCQFHQHVTHKKADAMIAVVFDRPKLKFFEGEGEARTVDTPSYRYDGGVGSLSCPASWGMPVEHRTHPMARECRPCRRLRRKSSEEPNGQAARNASTS
jgi:hypothetical protein